MKFSLEATDANQIHFYDDCQIIIGPEKQHYSIKAGASLIVTPDQIISNSELVNIRDLSEKNIRYLQKLAPEAIIFTSRTEPLYPLAKTIAELSQKSIGSEYMTLGAACRTYNLLVLEGRQVALVIL